MAIDDKQNVTLAPYIRRRTPALTESMQIFLTEELRQIESTIQSIADATPQATDTAPQRPRRGMVRYAIAPWDPISSGYSGLVVYNGSAWVQV